MMLSVQTRDFAGRSLMTAYFTVFAALKTMSVYDVTLKGDWTASWALDLISEMAGLAFLALVVAMTVARLPPVNSAEGLEPRVSALLGTFSTVALIGMPRVEVSPGVELFSTLLVLVGCSLCVWCLWWLGRSFSVMAQARRLITAGPYRFVRHPLYVCEALTLAGVVVGNPSWSALALAGFALAFQCRRMLNEEKVLRASFPNYDAYAARTPMLIPRLAARLQSA